MWCQTRGGVRRWTLGALAVVLLLAYQLDMLGPGAAVSGGAAVGDDGRAAAAPPAKLRASPSSLPRAIEEAAAAAPQPEPEPEPQPEPEPEPAPEPPAPSATSSARPPPSASGSHTAAATPPGTPSKSPVAPSASGTAAGTPPPSRVPAPAGAIAAPPPSHFPAICLAEAAAFPALDWECYETVRRQTAAEVAADPHRPLCWGYDDVTAAGLPAGAYTPPSRLLWHTILLTAVPVALPLPIFSFLATQCCDAVLWVWYAPAVPLPADPHAALGIPAHQRHRVVFKPLALRAMFESVAGDFAPEAVNLTTLARMESFADIRYVADWARILVMYVHGGTYFDVDTMLLRDLRPISNVHPHALQAYRNDGISPFVNNAYLRVPPRGTPMGLEVMTDALTSGDPLPDGLCKSLTKHPGGYGRLSNNATMIRYSTSVFDFIWWWFLARSNNLGFYVPEMLTAQPGMRGEWHWDGWFVSIRRALNGTGVDADAFLARVRSGEEPFLPGSYSYHWHNRYSSGLGDPESWPALLDVRYRKLAEAKPCLAPRPP